MRFGQNLAEIMTNKELIGNFDIQNILPVATIGSHENEYTKTRRPPTKTKIHYENEDPSYILLLLCAIISFIIYHMY